MVRVMAHPYKNIESKISFFFKVVSQAVNTTTFSRLHDVVVVSLAFRFWKLTASDFH